MRRPALYIGSLLGIMFAILLISSALMTADYLGYTLLQESLKDVKVDLDVTFYNPTVTIFEKHNDIAKRLKNISYVKSVDPVFFSMIVAKNITLNSTSINSLTKDLDSLCIIAIPPNFTLPRMKVYGNLSGPGIIIGAKFAENHNISLGDVITLNITNFEATGESYVFYFKVRAIISFEGALADALKFIIYEEKFDPNYAIMETFDNFLQWNLTRELIYSEDKLRGRLHLIAMLDRESIINPWNPFQTAMAISNVGREVELVITDQMDIQGDFVVSLPLLNKVSSVLFIVSASRTAVTINSIPALLLGVVLALITNWILVNYRRREIGLLKVRGASSGFIGKFLLTEIATAGLAGGVVGSLLGYLVAQFLLNILFSDLIEIYPVASVIGKFWRNYLIGGSIAGFILGFLSAILPVRSISKLDVSKALMEYVEEIEIEEKLPKWVWFSLGIGLYATIDLLLGMPTLRLLIRIITTSIVLVLILFLLIIMYGLIIISGPFVFPYGASRVIAHYSSKLDRFFSAIVKPISGRLSYYAVRNFARKRARTARIIFLITLTITFGVYYGIAHATQENRIRIETQFYVGSDIHVDLYTPINYNSSKALVDNISNIEYVYETCRIGDLFLIGTPSISLVFIDPEYFNTSFFDPSYLEDSSVKEVLSKFDEKHVLLSINAKTYFGYKDGDQIYVGTEYGALNFTILGFMKFAPGISLGLTDLQTSQSPLHVFINLKEVAKHEALKRIINMAGIRAILIKLKSNANVTLVKSCIEKVLTEIGLHENEYDIVSFIEELKKRSMYGVFSLQAFLAKIEFCLSLAIAIIGMILISIMAVIERKREFALLRTRGANLREIISIVGGESLLITLISFSLGLLVALAYSYGFLSSMMLGPVILSREYVEYPKGYLVTIPTYLLILMPIAFIIFVVAGIIPTFILTKKNLAEELRIHH